MIATFAVLLAAQSIGTAINPEPVSPAATTPAPAAAPAPAAPFALRARIIPASPAPATPIPVTAMPAALGQPLICKSSVETGSLIARRKQCLTKSQWRYVDDVQRQQTQDLFDDQRTKSGCTSAATC